MCFAHSHNAYQNGETSGKASTVQVHAPLHHTSMHAAVRTLRLHCGDAAQGLAAAWHATATDATEAHAPSLNTGAMQTFAQFLTEAADDTRIDPASFNLTTLYHALNQQCFGGVLHDYPIRWGRTPKGVSGVTNGKMTRKVGMPLFMATVDPASIAITINPHEYVLSRLKGIVAHEMVHAQNMQDNKIERDGHGGYFHMALRAAQQHADFTIPLADKMDELEKTRLVAKPVKVLCGAKRDGSTFVSLYTPNLNPESTAKLTDNVSHFVKYNYFAWLVFADGTSTLASELPVQRVYKGMGGYPADLSSVHITRVLASAGPVPADMR